MEEASDLSFLVGLEGVEALFSSVAVAVALLPLLPTARLIILAAASVGKALLDVEAGVPEKKIVFGSVFSENKGNDDAVEDDGVEGTAVCFLSF
jgi:hypothetical protein